jgi:hypothetical protein
MTTRKDLTTTAVTYHGERLTHFRARTATVDGIPSRRATVPRLMFDVITDTPGSAEHTCTADRPPIDEHMWLTQGRITDTDGTIYNLDGEIAYDARSTP